MRYVLIALAALSCLGGTSAAQPSPANDVLLQRLAGTWILRGDIAGRATTHDITAEWILDGLYLQIHEISREKAASGKPAYEAVVLLGWDAAAAEYQCLWLDSTGGGGLTPSAIARGKRKGETIPFLFREANGAVSFNNTFAYDRATDSWTWQMDNVQNGKAIPFGRVRLTHR
jgi:hypothetical protein